MQRTRIGKNTNKSDSGVPAVSAAALQDHFSRNLNLDMRVQQKRRKPAPKRMTDEQYVKQLTLAERMGLVKLPPKPPAPLSELEWKNARHAAQNRDAHQEGCPICYDDFRILPQVILSCSHVFHKTCLSSFEKFSGTRTCPLCRQKDYEKKVISDGALSYKHKCATKVQAFFRGYIYRKNNMSVVEAIMSVNPVKRRDLFAKKLTGVSDRLVAHLDAHERDIDDLLAECDKSMSYLKHYSSYSRGREVVWKEAIDSAEQRGWRKEDCPICVTSLLLHGKRKALKQKKLTVLTCSHVFHSKCITSFESFSISESAPVCPLCRSVYEKKDIEI